MRWSLGLVAVMGSAIFFRGCSDCDANNTFDLPDEVESVSLEDGEDCKKPVHGSAVDCHPAQEYRGRTYPRHCEVYALEGKCTLDINFFDGGKEKLEIVFEDEGLCDCGGSSVDDDAVINIAKARAADAGAGP